MTDKLLSKLGTNIRTARESSGMSQEELAARAGLHRTYIGGVERGERNLGIKNVVAIADALGVSPHELLLGIGHKRRRA